MAEHNTGWEAASLKAGLGVGRGRMSELSWLQRASLMLRNMMGITQLALSLLMRVWVWTCVCVHLGVNTLQEYACTFVSTNMYDKKYPNQRTPKPQYLNIPMESGISAEFLMLLETEIWGRLAEFPCSLLDHQIWLYVGPQHTIVDNSNNIPCFLRAYILVGGGKEQESKYKL